MPKSKEKKYTLLVIAHPDDEAIFMSGLILSQVKRNWFVVSVTDANADGKGHRRMQDFRRSLRILGVKKFEILGLPDRFESRLNTKKIKEKLKKIDASFSEVYTHGILGEYGHPHHQDVCFGVHEAFWGKIPVWSLSNQAYPEKAVHLSKRHFQIKTKLLLNIYGSETTRFLNLIPIQFSEGFHRVTRTEIRSIYHYFIGSTKGQGLKLSKYQHLRQYLKDHPNILSQRLF